MPTHLECARCGERHPADRSQNRCACGGTLLARYEVAVGLEELRARPPGMRRYRELLPSGDPVSLGEPQTPLIALPRISDELGVETYLKDDGLLPSGTFKARGAAAAVTSLAAHGVHDVVMPSAGNAGGAWAVYCARAGIALTVVVADDVPALNRAEAAAAGARIEVVTGTLADAGARAKEIAASTGAFLASTFSEPYRVDGKKTAWLEVFDALGDERAMRAPAMAITPVGGGVAAVAAHKALAESRAAGWLDGDMRIVGVQPQDCAPVVRAFEDGAEETEPWPHAPSTIAAGLRVPAPSEGYLVLRAVRETGGTMLAVSDEEIADAVGHLARTEGVLACPEGAATLCAARHLARRGDLAGPLVLYNTGAGIKYL